MVSSNWTCLASRGIKAAEQEVQKNYGRLDILVNNAGIGIFEKPDHFNLQESYAETFNTNIIGVALMVTTFLPLVNRGPKILASSTFPRSVPLFLSLRLVILVTSYSVSKTALNALTIEYAKAEPDVRFYATSPGNCKKAFNGFRGTKDPLDEAKVVVGLALAEKKYENGLWQMEGDEKVASPVSW